ncbi:MAG: hypothetical protein ACRETX_16165 [Steroidobacteraceae bacterium]
MLDDRSAERTNVDVGVRSAGLRGSSQLLVPGVRRGRQKALVNTKNRSHSVTAELEVLDGATRGVIVAQSGKMGGWSFYVHEGRLKYHYNFVGSLHSEVTATAPLAMGTCQVRMESRYDGGGIGRGCTVSLFIDGKKVGEGRIKRTHALFFSRDEFLELGGDRGEPISPDYGQIGNEFTGKIRWVRIDVDDVAKNAHLAADARRSQLALVLQ